MLLATIQKGKHKKTKETSNDGWPDERWVYEGIRRLAEDRKT